MMNKNIVNQIQAMRKHFSWDQSDTIEFMVDCIIDEAHELKDSLKEDEEAFKKELADVLMYAFAICIDKNYDVDSLISNKIQEVMKREY